MEPQEIAKEQERQPMTKRKKLLIAGSVFLVILLGAFAAGGAVLHAHFAERVLPNTFVGPIDLGGLTKSEATEALETWQEKWWSTQMQYEVRDESNHLLTKVEFFPLIVLDDIGSSQEFIWYDIPAMVTQAYDTGKSSSFLEQFFRELNLGHQIVLQPIVQIDDIQLREVLELELESFETLPQNAQFEWSRSTRDPIVISEQHGNIFDYDKAIQETRDNLITMKIEPVIIDRMPAIPEISANDAQELLSEIDRVKSHFPFVTTYQDPNIDLERKWTLKWQDAFQAVQPLAGEKITIGLSDDLEKYWSRIESLVNIDPSNAKFEIEDETKKVQQFQPSSAGYTFDREATLAKINTELAQEEKEEDSSVSIAVTVIEPEIKTADVNDLGITEMLGVGYSSFAGSPRNRIHNISVGVNKLNGILIGPDEEFSLLAALRPFTISGGYLPELVIKGDEIKPEIGGGLCQIGSTTFRAAMKAGLDITERRNHSLVVNYYNDPRNGNPGTDATIYDSSPDFKFKNDTGNYILLETEMNAYTGDLWFTFWGTSDGRKADYTEPVVHRWVGAGPTKYVDSTDLAPGEQKCQGAHPGASTSFTYSIERPDGTLEEEVFSSTYRPLPTICLVGVDPDAPAEGEEVAETPEPVVTESDSSTEEVVS